MRATTATAVPSPDGIVLTLYDRDSGSSMCALLAGPALAQHLAKALEEAAGEFRPLQSALPHEFDGE